MAKCIVGLVKKFHLYVIILSLSLQEKVDDKNIKESTKCVRLWFIHNSIFLIHTIIIIHICSRENFKCTRTWFLYLVNKYKSEKKNMIFFVLWTIIVWVPTKHLCILRYLICTNFLQLWRFFLGAILEHLHLIWCKSSIIILRNWCRNCTF